jgi:hypothetical protein
MIVFLRGRRLLSVLLETFKNARHNLRTLFPHPRITVRQPQFVKTHPALLSNSMQVIKNRGLAISVDLKIAKLAIFAQKYL